MSQQQLPILPTGTVLVNTDGTYTDTFQRYLNLVNANTEQAPVDFADANAAFIIQSADTNLPNAQVLDELSPGFVQVGTGGVFVSTGSTVITSSELSNTGVTPGNYTINGNPLFTVGSDGRVSLAQSVTIGSLPPSGTAGGDLSGAYPNPTVIKINGTQLSGLATGILKNTTSTGIPSIAIAADFPTLNQNTSGSSASCTGNAATATTLSGVLSPALGGTGLNNSSTTFNFTMGTVQPFIKSAPPGIDFPTSNTSAYGSLILQATSSANVPATANFPAYSGTSNYTVAGFAGTETSGYVLTSSGGTNAPSWQPSTGGSVTSVSFTGDGVILSSTPTTPVTSSGTLTATIKNQSGNVVLASPANGSTGIPLFREIVPADIAGFTTTNQFLASPVSGLGVFPSFRAIAAGDIPNIAQSLVQTVRSSTGAVATGTTVMNFNNTIPTTSNGDQYLALSITPTKSTNKLNINVIANASSSAAGTNVLVMALYCTTNSSNAVAVATLQNAPANPISIPLQYSMTAGSTSTLNFTVRIGAVNAGIVTLNGAAGLQFYGGSFISSIVITETTS